MISPINIAIALAAGIVINLIAIRKDTAEIANFSEVQLRTSIDTQTKALVLYQQEIDTQSSVFRDTNSKILEYNQNSLETINNYYEIFHNNQLIEFDEVMSNDPELIQFLSDQINETLKSVHKESNVTDLKRVVNVLKSVHKELYDLLSKTAEESLGNFQQLEKFTQTADR